VEPPRTPPLRSGSTAHGVPRHRASRWAAHPAAADSLGPGAAGPAVGRGVSPDRARPRRLARSLAESLLVYGNCNDQIVKVLAEDGAVIISLV
jgi:hypothetical protein